MDQKAEEREIRRAEFAERRRQRHEDLAKYYQEAEKKMQELTEQHKKNMADIDKRQADRKANPRQMIDELSCPRCGAVFSDKYKTYKHLKDTASCPKTETPADKIVQ